MPFHVGAYFCMGAYKHDVVVVIKMGAYIHGVLIIPILQYVCVYVCVCVCMYVYVYMYV